MTRLEQIREGIRTFLSTGEEWHAFVIGFCEILCPWRSRFSDPSAELLYAIMDEFHYYQAGRSVGFLCLLACITGLIKIFI